MRFCACQVKGGGHFAVEGFSGLENTSGNNKPEGFVNRDSKFHDLAAFGTDNVAGQRSGGTGHEYGDDIVTEAFSEILGGLAGEQSQRPDPLAGILQSHNLGVLEAFLGEEEIGDLLDLRIDLADDGSAIEKGFDQSPNPSANEAGQEDAKEVDQAYSDDEAADVQIPFGPDVCQSGYAFIDVAAEYPQLGVGDEPDDSGVYILADVLIDELIALDDQDQAKQTRKHSRQASEKEVLEIGPKSFFPRFLFHRFAIFVNPAFTAGCEQHIIQDERPSTTNTRLLRGVI